jgi:hypothetical protein
MRVHPGILCVFLALTAVVVLASPASAGDAGIACMASSACTEGQVCSRPIGTCDQPGACVSKPTSCREVFDPVCGCNGQTYDNECYAALDGASVVALGPCEAMACLTATDCPAGFFCRPATGACGSVGTCAVMPAICNSLIYMPVCGCNGETYDNACLASQAGVSIASLGACHGHKCSTYEDCNTDHYCLKPGRSCNQQGRCAQRPEVCYDLYAPVCGCDGQVYSNSCFAAMAGVSVANAGVVCQ